MKEVVIAAIFIQDRLLVGQRLSDPFKGYWECPGGNVEGDEDLVEALVREIQEEGKVKVDHATSMFDYEVMTPAGPLHLTWFYTTLCDQFDPTIYNHMKTIKKEEVDALAWIPHNRPYLEKLKTFFPIQT